MKLKILSKRILFIASIVTAIFLISIFFLVQSVFHKGFIPFIGNLVLQSPIGTASVVSVSNVDSGANINLGFPVRLAIPKIKVDSKIEYVGLNSDGVMDVPKGPDNVAWFEPGVRPGEIGSAVIAGHEGWKNGIPAVFDNLHELKKGDVLYVEDAKGVGAVFVVRELRTYGQYDNASDVFSSNDGKAHLNLITCEGVWDKSLKSYSNRLVVFTDEE